MDRYQARGVQSLVFGVMRLRLLVLLALVVAACSSGNDGAAAPTQAASAATATTAPLTCANTLDAVDAYIVDRTTEKTVATPDSFGQCRYNAAAPAPCVDAMRTASDVVDTTTAETFDNTVIRYRSAAAACRQML